MISDNDGLAHMFEIYSDAIADYRLYLAVAPIWLVWMLHKIANTKFMNHIVKPPLPVYVTTIC